MKKIYQFAVFCFILTASLCTGYRMPAYGAVSLNQSSATICVGSKTALKVEGTTKKVKWTTSNARIAKVGTKGVVTGVKKGKATITASVGSKKYKCRVTVNQTYGASESSVSIKRSASVMFTFTQDAVVTYKIQDTNICSASWGSWSGNEIPLNIVPKKVGTTYITCSNGANQETVRIKVRVTKVPVKVTRFKAATDDGGDFVCGLNKIKLSFRQDIDSKKTIVYLMNKNGETVRTLRLGTVEGGKNQSVVWDGWTDSNTKYNGEFRMRVSADGYVTKDQEYYRCYADSPFEDGCGTKSHPYEVTSADQLSKMAEFNGRYFVQTKDIDLRSELVNTIFSAEKPFSGSFNAKPQDVNYKILYYNGNASLFGSIGPKGELENVTMSEARISSTGLERTAVVAENNQGTISGCVVDQVIVYSASSTDVGILAVENNGVIDGCRVNGTVYTYGNMGGGVLYNRQRMIRTRIEVRMNLSAAEDITDKEQLYVGGIAAVNEQRAFIDECESNCTLRASGTLPKSSHAYLGGIAGRNLGLVRDGGSLGYFPLDYTEGLRGDVQGGIIVGDNGGMITGVSYYETAGRKISAAGNGREDSLRPLINPNEEA